MTRDTEVREAAKAQKRGNGPGNWGGPIGAKVVSHGRYVAFQMAEVAIPRQMFQEILRLIGTTAAAATTDGRTAPKCQGKGPDQPLDNRSELSEVLVAVRTSLSSCRKSG
jgi:hypothetical protein